MASSSRHSGQHANHGIPARPPTASTPLWNHLLRSTSSSEVPASLNDMTVVAPPSAPLDKNATSMRVLLHDTQANFETFTSHVGNLLENITETKSELRRMQSMFEGEREGLLGDIIDLVNRSQKELQKSIGEPSQAGSVATQFKDFDHRLEGLDQRLDALHAFNQTHSQALQTQIQAVQILLDKQGTIITAVLPLLPLIQALPLHIEAAKAALLEKIGQLSTRMLSDMLPLSANTHTRKRNRDDDGTRNSSSPLRPQKRQRSTLPDVSEAHRQLDQPSSDTTLVVQVASAPKNPENSSSSSSSGGQSSPTPRIAPKAPSPFTQTMPRGTASTLTTPRKPLGELLQPNHGANPNHTRTPSLLASRRNHVDHSLQRSGSRSSSTPSRSLASAIFAQAQSKHHLYAPSTSSTSPPAVLQASSASGNTSTASMNGIYARSGTHTAPNSSPIKCPIGGQATTPSTPQVFLGITPTAARPPRMLRMHTSIQDVAETTTSKATVAPGLSASTIPTSYSAESKARVRPSENSIDRPTINQSRAGSSGPMRFVPRQDTTITNAGNPTTSQATSCMQTASSRASMPPPNPPRVPRSYMRSNPAEQLLQTGNIQSETASTIQSSSGIQHLVDHRRPNTRPGKPFLPPSRPASSMSTRSQATAVFLPTRPSVVPSRAQTPAIGSLVKGKEAVLPKEGRRFIPLIDSDDEEQT